MHIALPKIIQGGMGVGVSNWHLAQAVSKLGHLGVVSGTALDLVMARRLQTGDPGGHVRRALRHFVWPQMAQRVLDALFVPGGIKPDEHYTFLGLPTIKENHARNELCIVSNFVEVFLAREGHSNPVGINYLEKIQLPHLPSLYGAMLAGVAVVIVGAGIAVEFPGVLDVLAQHQPATYSIRVHGAQADTECTSRFDPGDYLEAGAALPALSRPDFLPIISSDALASIFIRKASGRVDGFVVESPQAGGHNAPPRGTLHLTDDGQPIYGPRDTVNFAAIRKLGLPFWVGGSYDSPEQLKVAEAEGAAGIQVGTAFALCTDSGLPSEIRRTLVAKALAGEAHVFTDPVASPTGFPFKVAQLEGTLSERAVYLKRQRICDLGYLREPYRREDGTVGYRCAAEPELNFLAKGGKADEMAGRICVCNGLLANIGLAQRLPGRVEPCLLTLGDSFASIGRFCRADSLDFSAEDVVRTLLG
ncbi:MAG: nitronate monooxygenase [Lentisphaerae bacterium]|nr:nitronate monooxygenase [Lentisphaerota bacterium]